MYCYHLSCPKSALRAVIALNNVGCTLLERGCYLPAHQTLKDAVQAMVLLLSRNGMDDETRKMLATRLADADRRLAVASSSSLSTTSSHFELPAPLRWTVADGGGGNDDDDSSEAMALVLAIAVHNSALPCFYQSVVVNEIDKRFWLNCKAKALLRTSYQLVSGRLGNNNNGALTRTTTALVVAPCHGLHILESLHRVVLRATTSRPRSPYLGGAKVDDDAAAAATPTPTADAPEVDDELRAIEEELRRVNALVRAVEGADRLLFGWAEAVAAAA